MDPDTIRRQHQCTFLKNTFFPAITWKSGTMIISYILILYYIMTIVAFGWFEGTFFMSLGTEGYQFNILDQTHYFNMNEVYRIVLYLLYKPSIDNLLFEILYINIVGQVVEHYLKFGTLQTIYLYLVAGIAGGSIAVYISSPVINLIGLWAYMGGMIVYFCKIWGNIPENARNNLICLLIILVIFEVLSRFSMILNNICVCFSGMAWGSFVYMKEPEFKVYRWVGIVYLIIAIIVLPAASFLITY